MFRRWIIVPILLLLIGGGVMYVLLAYHFVTTKDGSVRVPKAAMTFDDTFVDITAWEARDFVEHPDLTRALLDNGHEDLVPKPVQAGDKVLDKLDDLFQKGKDKLDDILGGQNGQ